MSHPNRLVKRDGVIINKPPENTTTERNSNRLVKRDGIIINKPDKTNTSTGWYSERNPNNVTQKQNSNRKIIPGNRTSNAIRKTVNIPSKITEDLNLEKVITADGKSRLTLQTNRKTKKTIYPGFDPTQRLTTAEVLAKKNRKTISRMQPQPLKQVIKPKIIRPKEFNEMIIEIVTKITMNKNIDRKTKDTRSAFYYKTNSCIEIIKDICKHKDWDILNGILLQPKYFGKFGSEFLQWDDLVPTLLENISKDNSKLFTPILLFINTKYINCKNEKDLENVLDDIDKYLENTVNTRDKDMEAQFISHLKHIKFFNENDEEEYYTTDLVDKQLYNIFDSIIRLNKKNNILKYFMSVIYKIIKFKYIKHDGDMFLDEELLYNETKGQWDIVMDSLNKDIDTYVNAKKRNSNSIKTSFFGLLDISVCENPMLKDEKDKLIIAKFPAVRLFIEFFCRKKREGRLMVNTRNVPRQDIPEKTVPMRGEKNSDDSESE